MQRHKMDNFYIYFIAKKKIEIAETEIYLNEIITIFFCHVGPL